MNYKNFNAIVYTADPAVGSKGFVTYHKQTSIDRFKAYCNVKYPQWRWITLYDRKTNEKQILKHE